MSGLRVPPGRGGVLYLRRRIAAAQTGADLLNRKLTALRAEQTRRAVIADAAAQRWETTGRQAQRSLGRAAMLAGERGIRLAALPPTATVAYDWADLLGLRFPGAARCTPAPRPTDAPPLRSSALIDAEAAVRVAVEAAADHAAARRSVRVLQEEAALTRRRLRALEYRWIPRLRAALTTARMQVDELENADAVRRRWAAGLTDQP